MTNFRNEMEKRYYDQAKNDPDYEEGGWKKDINLDGMRIPGPPTTYEKSDAYKESKVSGGARSSTEKTEAGSGGFDFPLIEKGIEMGKQAFDSMRKKNESPADDLFKNPEDAKQESKIVDKYMYMGDGERWAPADLGGGRTPATGHDYERSAQDQYDVFIKDTYDPKDFDHDIVQNMDEGQEYGYWQKNFEDMYTHLQKKGASQGQIMNETLSYRMAVRHHLEKKYGKPESKEPTIEYR
tara:strand:- start:437 stop:1153 length:717 start_codon:yes stop_codon:yes gene_type:complete